MSSNSVTATNVPLVPAGPARMPALGFGTWQMTGDSCRRAVSDALAIGYRHVDTAQMYENHEAVGRGLADASVDRDEVFLTTKVWWENLRPEQIAETMEQSLKELGTDHVDLTLIHWPNDDVPLEQSLEALAEQREKGRTKHVGVSNFPPSLLAQASERAPLACDQVEYHPLLSQEGLHSELESRGQALVAYSPLAHGEAVKDPLVREIAEKHDRSPAQVCLRWLVQQDGVAAIPKAGSREHAEENFRIFDFELEEADMGRLHELARTRGRRTVDPDFAPDWER